MPDACKDREVASAAFKKRVRDLKRLEKFTSIAYNHSTYAVHWKAVGCYELVFGEDEYVKQITHRTSGATVELPEHVMISENDCLLENWNDYTAWVEFGPKQVLLV